MELKPKEMWFLKEILDIKNDKCKYCGNQIKKGDKFSIFNKPTRLICEGIVCLARAVDDDEDE